MTDKVSRPASTMAAARFPDVCPLCGQELLRAVSVSRDVDRRIIRSHFIAEHPGRTGTAIRRYDARAFDFAWITHEVGASRWHVAVFDWPFEIVTIIPDEYVVQWRDK